MKTLRYAIICDGQHIGCNGHWNPSISTGTLEKYLLKFGFPTFEIAAAAAKEMELSDYRIQYYFVKE